MQLALPVLHAGGGRGAVAARGAAVARRADAAGARLRRRRRRQAAAHGRRAHAALRPRRHHTGAVGNSRHPLGGDDDQRACADAAAAGTAARRPHASQRVAGLAAPGPVRGHGAPTGAGARAGRRGPGAAARVRARQDQRRAHEGVQRRRDLGLRGVHARPQRRGAVHRVHAVQRQPLGRRQAGAVPRRAGRRARRARPRAAAAARQRHRQGVARGGARRRRGLHHLHDAALLRRLQPAAAHRRRQPQGLPVRRGGGVPARRAARRRLRRRARGAAARRAAQQEAAARRHAGARAHGQPAHDPHRRLAAPARALCSRAADGGGLSHLDAAGRARMVDVGDKAVTRRAAAAECRLEVSARLLRLLRDARLPKGDALCVARVAGALAAKRTADLLPLCHPLPLECARVHVELPPAGARGGAVRLTCEVRVTARTGAEMEALTGCAVAALALYDMCKSVDRDMRITGLRLLYKTGGRSEPAPPPPPPPPPAREPERAPRDAGAETYAPTNFMNF